VDLILNISVKLVEFIYCEFLSVLLDWLIDRLSDSVAV